MYLNVTRRYLFLPTRSWPQSTDVDCDPALLKARPLALTPLPPRTNEGPLVSSVSVSAPPSSSGRLSLPRRLNLIFPPTIPRFLPPGSPPASLLLLFTAEPEPSCVNLTLDAPVRGGVLAAGAATFFSSRPESTISSTRRVSASNAPFHPSPSLSPPSLVVSLRRPRLSATSSSSIPRISRASSPALPPPPPPPPRLRSRSALLALSTSSIIIASRR